MNTTFVSLLGIASLLAIAVLFSKNRQRINYRTVVCAFILQVLIGASVLYFPLGKDVLATVSSGVSQVIGYGQQGSAFLFGGLADNTTFELGLGFIFAFRVLPTIIFFSALIAVLYYLGIMQLTVRILGGALRKCLGTSKTESLSATANIFVGQTEAPMLVRPYIANMTQSELFAVMCGGLASVAGSVIAGYASMGVKMEYLIAASFMAAPGGILFAKLLLPETQKPNDDADLTIDADDKPANVIDAAASGAASGLQLALNVGAMLLAFVALITLLNESLGGIGRWFGIPDLSLQLLLGKIFAPFAYLLGIPWGEATVAGSILGQKIVVNEFIAYSDLSRYLSGQALIPETQAVMSEHSQAVLSFALCGFANLSSVAILLGGLGGMAPNRRHDIAKLGLLAILAGTLSNFMSATIAGLFLSL